MFLLDKEYLENLKMMKDSYKINVFKKKLIAYITNANIHYKNTYTNTYVRMKFM